METPDSQVLLGRKLGEFTVRELLSTGGFGMVFRAEQQALEREAVIKVLHAEHRYRDTIALRFLREAQLASKLDHPYAAHTYAFGAEPDGVLWIAMELVRGTPLDKLLAAQGSIPLERFVPLLDAICEVIHTAHERGIIHRDLKPANVMVLARAGRLLPKLLDFGIAKLIDAPEPAPVGDPSLAETLETTGDPGYGRLTEEGATMGSPLYMAPEQWVDAGAADARTDQYALGVLCYEALTGKPPFPATTRMQIAMAHARKAPPPLGGDAPPALDAVIARAMAKRPEDRYPNVLELAAAFRAASGIGAETPALPGLPDELRAALTASAPQPLAHAIAVLDAARNPHQARDALWGVVRTTTRLLGVIALASHGHVGASVETTGVGTLLRDLRRHALGDADWLGLARALCRPFESMRDAHPVPELVTFLSDPPPELAELLELRAASEDTSDEKVRELLVRGLALAAEVLAELRFLADYTLVVPREGGAEVWLGASRTEHRQLQVRGRPLPADQPALVDAGGVPVLGLWPYLQLLTPAPGAAPALFFFDGKGRRGGARMVALPDGFERDDDTLWESFGALIEDEQGGEQVVSSEEHPPFPGLAAFTRDDAATFLGRERETEAFVNRLRVTPFLAVVGPSGAGKSSFVQAGVLPSLPDDWEAITVRPGPAPLVSLGLRLQIGDLRGELQDHPGALGSMLRARGRTTVLVIDQLEELFTLCEDAAERQLFAEALVRAARSVEDPVRIVVTLRDDFLLRAESLPAFRSRLGQGLQLLTTPAEADLRRILVDSVARVGYDFDDPALPGEMAASLAGAPNALALLSFTARKLWDLRDRRFRQLGRKAYTTLGGVGGALAHHAEATLEAMSRDEQRLVREVFRHAVTSEGTRAVLTRSELDQVLGGGAHAAAVVEKLVAARLLAVSEAEGGRERIEITHEALLEAWPRLVTWRREDAEGSRLRDQLRAAARQWDDRGRPSGLLWRGDALAEYRLWRARYPGSLTGTEDAFASASQADTDRARRRRNRLIGAAFVVLAGGVVALLLLNARADAQRRSAERSRREAEIAAAELGDNVRRQYENQGRRRLLDGDPLQALAYLGKAAELGVAGPAHDFLVAEAVQETDGELFSVAHDFPVVAVAFSPDGARLATAGYDNAAKLWDAESGAPVSTLAHAGYVLTVAYSDDGRWILTAGAEGAVLWDARSGARVRTLVADPLIRCAQFAPGAASLVTAGGGGAATVWDTATGAARYTVEGSRADAFACAVSADGRRAAVSDEDGAVVVWDLASGSRRRSWSAHPGGVRRLALSGDGQSVFTAGVDGKAAIWDAGTGRARHTLAHRSSVNDAAPSSDGTRVVTASDDRTAAVWDAQTGMRLLVLEHPASVNRAVLTADGTGILTAGDDATVRLWDAVTGRLVARWHGHAGAIGDLAFAPGGRSFATASEDSTATVWSVEPAQRAVWLRGHTGVIATARLSPDGRHVVTAGYDGTARVWDAATGTPLATLDPRSGALRGARFSPDGTRIATIGRDGALRLWDWPSGAPGRVIANGERALTDVSWSSDGRTIAVASLDGTLRLWDADSGALRWSKVVDGGQPTVGVGFDPTGPRLATAGATGWVRIWDAAAGTELAGFEDPEFRSAVEFDPSGRRIASPLGGAAVRIWDVETGKGTVDLVGHAASALAATWSPDGNKVATGGYDATVRIWDAAAGDELETIPLGGPVLSVAFSPDGTRLVASTQNGLAAIWTLPPPPPDRSALERLIRCRVPFRFDGDRLVPAARDRAACTPDAATPGPGRTGGPR